MEKQSECIKVKNRDGKVLLSIYPSKDVLIETRPQNETDQGKEAKDNKGGNGNGKNNGDGMTFPQKKFLFRLLAGQGIEGDQAHARLKELFKVEALKEIGKIEASRMIERLLKESKGGDNRESSVG